MRLVVAATAAVCGIGTLGAHAAGGWKTAPAMPNARAAHAVVVAGGSIYVLGGPGTSAVDRFDGKRWRREATLPGGRLNAPAAAAVGRTIVLTGGFRGAGNTPTTAVWLYDTRRRSWRRGAPLPAPRGGHAAAVLAGKVHILGGGNSSSTIADHSVYDPASDSWRDAAPLPRAEGSPAAVAANGKLYAIGGRSGLDDYGDVYVYVAAQDRWSNAPSIPPRGTVGAAVHKRSIYVFGGESQARARTLADVYRLAPGATRWVRVTGMPTARNYARAVSYGGAIYVVGGSRSAGASHSAGGSTLVDRFTPPG